MLWDIQRKAVVKRLSGGRGSFISCIAFTADGKTIVADIGHRQSPFDEIRAWRVEDGRLLSTIKTKLRVSQMAFAPNRIYLAGDGLQCLSWPSGEELKTITPRSPSRQLSLSNDGNTLAVLGFNKETKQYPVTVWDVRNNQKKYEIDDPGDALLVPKIAFSPDGKSLAVRLRRRVRLYATDTGKMKCVFSQGCFPYLSALVFSPDGRTIATGSAARGFVSMGFLQLWDAETGRAITNRCWSRFLVFGLAFSVDGKSLAVGGYGFKPKEEGVGIEGHAEIRQFDVDKLLAE
ncbi:MAG: WD40 repeat domain-containing protein [Planctomycetes bacterium]|nr:WD40 repeat domain-containing protein [Planctomycetota bacterium]